MSAGTIKVVTDGMYRDINTAEKYQLISTMK